MQNIRLSAIFYTACAALLRSAHIQVGCIRIHAMKKTAVVRYDYQRAWMARQCLLQSLLCLNLQMVGWLVK